MAEITVTYGDAFAIENDEDAAPAVRIQNGAFEEDPRWLSIDIVGGDRTLYLDRLIWAIEDLRDGTSRPDPR